MPSRKRSRRGALGALLAAAGIALVAIWEHAYEVSLARDEGRRTVAVERTEREIDYHRARIAAASLRADAARAAGPASEFVTLAPEQVVLVGLPGRPTARHAADEDGLAALWRRVADAVSPSAGAGLVRPDMN